MVGTGDKEAGGRTRRVSPNAQGMSGYLCPTRLPPGGYPLPKRLLTGEETRPLGISQRLVPGTRQLSGCGGRCGALRGLPSPVPTGPPAVPLPVAETDHAGPGRPPSSRLMTPVPSPCGRGRDLSPAILPRSWTRNCPSRPEGVPRHHYTQACLAHVLTFHATLLPIKEVASHPKRSSKGADVPGINWFNHTLITQKQLA